MRIAVARFSHETCTFCPNPTTVEMFEKGGIFHGEEVIERYRGIPTYVNGFIKVAEEEGVELVGILDASRAYGGSSGSWLTKECFEKYSNGIAKGLKKAGHLDGLLLSLHGGMAAQRFLKPEAEVVRRARKAVGDIPIMVTLDLHANEDHELTDAADAVFILKEFPHTDSEEIGMVAARCMVATVRGEFKPTMAIRKPGVISPSVLQGTSFYPAKDIYERCREWEAKEEDAYCVSAAMGFAYADVPDGGATVIAVTNGNQELAERIAQDVSDFIWSVRGALTGKEVPKTKEGVDKVLEAVGMGVRPVIVADHSDRMGDSTHILRELLAQGARNFAVTTIADPKAIREIEKRGGLGAKVTVKVGGYACKYSGEPVELTGEVEFLDDGSYERTGPMGRGAKATLGTVAALNLGSNNHVVLTQTLHQVTDDGIFHRLGIDFEGLDIIVLKSRVHFRAFYEGVAGKIIEIDAPGLGPADLTQQEYKNEPKDIYPIGEKWRK